MTQHSILITGSTDGIGKQAALQSAAAGHHVVLHGKNSAKLKNVVKELKHATNNDRIEGYTADFTSLTQVRRMADEIRRDRQTVNILINNAGTYQQRRFLSEDGFEATYAINFLALSYLTLLLLDTLRQNAPARIVNVSSMVHAHPHDFERHLRGETPYEGYQAYAFSKLCVVMFTYDLAQKLKNSAVTANCLHPGVIDTKLLHAAGFSGGAPVQRGADNLIYLATDSALEGATGKYFMEQSESRSSALAFDPVLRDKLRRKTRAVLLQEAFDFPGLNDFFEGGLS